MEFRSATIENRLRSPFSVRVPQPPASRPSRLLSIALLTNHLRFSGGRKQLLEYGKYLEARGHRVDVFAMSAEGELSGLCQPRVVSAFNRHTLPAVDLIVASQPQLVASAVESGQGRVVHFCQGSQVIYLENRIVNGIEPSRLSRSRLLKPWRTRRKHRQWQRKIASLDAVFRLPSSLVTISPYLKDYLQNRYNKPVYLCNNGVHREHFFPGTELPAAEFDDERPCRVVCVGSLDQTVKGIEHSYEAVRLAKSRGCPIHFIHVSPTGDVSQGNKELPIDELHVRLNASQMGRLFRSCDVFVSNSLEGEGFGLPAMEALSCGLNCILSDISSYRGFDESDTFCHFVKQNDAEATAATLWDIVYSSSTWREQMRRQALDVASHYPFEGACQTFAHSLEEIAAV